MRVIEEATRVAIVRRWISGTFSGRMLVSGAAIRLLAYAARLLAGPSRPLQVLDIVGVVAIIAGAVALSYRLFVDIKRVVLWRVRRKLTLSYVFIGFVPVLLIIAFFLIAFVLLLNDVSAFVIHNRVAAIEREAQSLAELAAAEVRNTDAAHVDGMLTRLQQTAAATYPGITYAWAPADERCSDSPAAVEGPPVARPLLEGLVPPTHVPSWISCKGFTGVVEYVDPPLAARMRGHLAVRAVAWPDRALPRAIIVTLPLVDGIAKQMEDDTGVELRDVSAVYSAPNISPDSQQPAVVEGLDTDNALAGNLLDRPIEWVVFFEVTDWTSGHTSSVSPAIRTTTRAMTQHLAPSERVGSITFGEMLLLGLAVVGGLFFVIQMSAFLMGLSLARSITGSVHELFVGTERVRRGDFTHKIAIRSRDQLGELAASFNSMTGSIEELLQQKAEKERLAQELLIARNIQMSLLPQTGMSMPGLSITAHCEPAREVGGDYYDFLPLDDKRLAVLIADVAGKGTSAALYMAELKGIILSLSQRYLSPRELLIDANRILARHLDTRTFITITYAVIDLESRTITYARAGHCPLLYIPGPYSSERRTQVLVPDGMVLGLSLDVGTMFNQLLEECTLPLGSGDLFLLYTDGITEAMNAEGDCFGDGRLSALLEEHGDLPSDQLRERIIREVVNFAGTPVQQDDMTMLIVKVEEMSDRSDLRDNESQMAWSQS